LKQAKGTVSGQPRLDGNFDTILRSLKRLFSELSALQGHNSPTNLSHKIGTFEKIRYRL